MKTRVRSNFHFFSAAIILWVFFPALVVGNVSAGTSIVNLRIQNSVEPLSVEDTRPVFSWQMVSDMRGQKQTAYRVVVTRKSDNRVVWNSGRVESGISDNIRYMGVALQPETDYFWEVTVWDKDNQSYNASSFFAMGLMNPKMAAWKGAQFIGTKKPYLDAASHSYFEINTSFQLTSGNKVSLIFGANDFRFNNSFQNIYNLAGENYVRIEIDLSETGKEIGAVLNIYRVGYANNDSPHKPFISISKALYPETNINDIFTTGNKHERHNLQIHMETSNVSFVIDNVELISKKVTQKGFSSGFSVGNVAMRISQATKFQVGPWGNNHDFNTAPHTGFVGFAAMPESRVIYSGYSIRHRGQSTDNIAFDAETGNGYSVFKDIPNTILDGNNIIVNNTSNKMTIGYADPSHGALPMLRTRFTTANKATKARLYVTAMGGYEVFMNGHRINNDWFAPGGSQFRETLGYHAYDVTQFLREGDNVLGAMLNQGWYIGYMTFTMSNFNFYGDHEALLAKLVITYEDGNEETVVTNQIGRAHV